MGKYGSKDKLSTLERSGKINSPSTVKANSFKLVADPDPSIKPYELLLELS